MSTAAVIVEEKEEEEEVFYSSQRFRGPARDAKDAKGYGGDEAFERALLGAAAAVDAAAVLPASFWP